ncbi:MAG: histidine phosphatase family protein [Leptospiraceae bacterium]|nr:histidine phosphatase family protein [Leptospiraceae bacterium]
MVIKLVRHGESLGNTGRVVPQISGDPDIPLTKHGKEQAKKVSTVIGREFIKSSLIYCSPYKRTQETLDEVLKASHLSRTELRIYEDPRLREVDFGYGDIEAQQEQRKVHGWFYYRYEGGESPADCYDRTSVFLESMMRQVTRRNQDTVLIITHGITIRCFVMRFLHLTVKQFNKIKNPDNCDVITIASNCDISEPDFTSQKWAVKGLKLYGSIE